MLMPRFVRMRTSRRRTSSSSGASTFGRISTTVTLEPRALNMQASSMPITPPPTQNNACGKFGQIPAGVAIDDVVAIDAGERRHERHRAGGKNDFIRAELF